MIHDAAATGFQRQSKSYANARPSYHPLVIAAVAEAIGERDVVDLGAGTGISTAALAGEGLAVTAIEPVEAMRATLATSIEGIEVVEGTAESMPNSDSSVGAVVVAQAFHWFDHGPAIDEITRVLESDGLLITLWNVRDESVPWMAAYTAVQDRYQGDTPRYRDMAWRDSIEADERFELIEEMKVPNPQPSNVKHTLARFLSTSFIARLDPETQQQAVAEVRALVTDFGESFDFPYWSEAQVWQRVRD